MKRGWGNVLLVLGGTMAAVVLLEIALRAAGISYPSLYTVDGAVGPVLRPGAEGPWTAEGGAYIRISSDGLRDREHARAKPPGTYRIAVLGDSYAEALQVPVRDTFWAAMERELAACPSLGGRRVEAINFGVSGYGTAQELLMLRHRAGNYDPDLVLLAFSTGNDVRNNVRALENDPRLPYFVYRGDVLTLDNGYLGSWRYRQPGRFLFGLGSRLIDSSRILQVANQAKNVVLSRRAAARQQSAANGASSPPGLPPAPAGGASAAGNPAPPGAELGLDDMVFREPDTPLWREAWRMTEDLIAAMGDEAGRRGATFVVVTLSSGIQVHPDPGVREAYRRQVGSNDLFYPDRRVKAFCDRKGIPALTLAPAFLEYAERNRVFLHGFGDTTGMGHWNRDGHGLAGRLIAQAICRNLPAPGAGAGAGANPPR